MPNNNNTVYGRIYSRMTSYLKNFEIQADKSENFPSGCPQLPEIQNTKVDYEGTKVRGYCTKGSSSF